MPDATGTPTEIDLVSPEAVVQHIVLTDESEVELVSPEVVLGAILTEAAAPRPSVVRIRCPFPPRLSFAKAVPQVAFPLESSIALTCPVPTQPSILFKDLWIGAETESLTASPS